MALAFFIPFGMALLLTAIAAVTDTRTGHIPNWLTLPPVVLAPILHGVLLGGQGWEWSLAGIFICGALPYLMFRSGGMGGGDVKLFAALGGVLGPGRGLEVQFAAMSVGALYSLIQVARRGRAKALFRNTWTVVANWFRPAAKQQALEHSASDSLRLGVSIFVGTFAVVAWRSWEAR